MRALRGGCAVVSTGTGLSRVSACGTTLGDLLLPFLLYKLGNQGTVMDLPRSEALGAVPSAASLPGAGSRCERRGPGRAGAPLPGGPAESYTVSEAPSVEGSPEAALFPLGKASVATGAWCLGGWGPQT